MNPVNTGVGYTGPDVVTAVGVYPGYEEARRAVEELRAAGYRDDQIGVLGPADARKAAEEHAGLKNDPLHTHWEEGAGLGAATGGLAGLGLGAAVAAGLISPLGPVIAGGTLVALIASIGAGATVGTMVGALAGAGVPEDDARLYAEEAQKGNVIVTVRAPSGGPAWRVFERTGGIHASATAPTLTPERAVPGNAVVATPY